MNVFKVVAQTSFGGQICQETYWLNIPTIVNATLGGIAAAFDDAYDELADRMHTSWSPLNYLISAADGSGAPAVSVPSSRSAGTNATEQLAANMCLVMNWYGFSPKPNRKWCFLSGWVIGSLDSGGVVASVLTALTNFSNALLNISSIDGDDAEFGIARVTHSPLTATHFNKLDFHKLPSNWRDLETRRN